MVYPSAPHTEAVEEEKITAENEDEVANEIDKTVKDAVEKRMTIICYNCNNSGHKINVCTDINHNNREGKGHLMDGDTYVSFDYNGFTFHLNYLDLKRT